MTATETIEQTEVRRQAEELEAKADRATDDSERKWFLHQARSKRKILEGRLAVRTYRNEETGRVRTELGRVTPKIGRNDPCPCESGQKFKRCHGRDH